MYDLFGFGFIMGCTYPILVHLELNVFPRKPTILSHVKGEKNLVSFVEHVIGEEKYECWLLCAVVRVSSSVNGSEMVGLC